MTLESVVERAFARMIAVLGVIVVSCTAGPYSKHDSRVEERIATASLREPTRRESRLVTLVLHDILDKTYRYSHETRTAALTFVQKSPQPALRRLTIEIAELSIEARDEGKQTLDAIAIADALSALTRLRDPEALRLNRARLREFAPFAFERAVFDLELLQDWASTPEIERAFAPLGAEMSAGAAIHTVLGFLLKSPLTSQASCDALDQIAAAADSFRSGTPLMQEVPLLAERLAQKLKCERSPK